MKNRVKTLGVVFVTHFIIILSIGLSGVYLYAFLSSDEIIRHEATHQQIAEEFGAAACGNISIVYDWDKNGNIIKGTTYYNVWCLDNTTRQSLLIAQANNEVLGNQVFPFLKGIISCSVLICYVLVLLHFFDACFQNEKN